MTSARWSPLIILAGGSAILAPVGEDLRLIGATVAAIALIVLDERFRFEHRVESLLNVPVREFWVPVALLAGLVAADLLSLDLLRDSTADKMDILVFILSFALIAEGLRTSGFVTFLAYRFAERCRGNTHRLILYLFVLASGLTYFTSNDIVVLTLTPIIFSVALQARIENARLLLLSQFVAANTVSMGLLIGSPTNIIVGDILGINFFEYALVMAVPTVYSFIVTFIAVDLINRLAESRSGIGRWLPETWRFQSAYKPPRFTTHREITRPMTRWLLLFLIAVVALAINTLVGAPLYFTAATIVLGSAALRMVENRSAGQGTNERGFVRALPFGILPFGIVLFAIARRLTELSFVEDSVTPFVEGVSSSGSPAPSLVAIFGSGATVNLLNDLPASALTAEIVGQVNFDHRLDEMQTTIGLLTGVNIGTYVTPIGALAGIIWFGILRRMQSEAAEREFSRVEVPTRAHLVGYGAACFVVVALALAVVQYTWVGLINFLVGPASDSARIDAFGPWYLFLPACCFTGALPFVLHRSLQRNGIVLLHLADVFAVFTRLRLWVLHHRASFTLMTAGLLFLLAGATLYGIEDFYGDLYRTEIQFGHLSGFISWFSTFVASGFEQDLFPESFGGVVICATTALGSIAAVVYLARVWSDDASSDFRRRIAVGEVPSQRVLLLHASSDHEELLRELLQRTRAFIVCASRPAEVARLRRYFLGHPSRGYVLGDWGTVDQLLAQTDPLAVDQIFLLSSGSQDDLSNVSAVNILEELAASLDAESKASIAVDSVHPVEMPEVVLQLTNRNALSLLSMTETGELAEYVSVLGNDDCFTEYLIAEAAGPLEAVENYFAIPSTASELSVLNHLEFGRVDIQPAIVGSALNARNLRRELLTAIRMRAELPSGSVVFGIEVRLGGRIERLTVDAYLDEPGIGEVVGAVFSEVVEETGRRTPEWDATTKRVADLSATTGYVVVGSGSEAVAAAKGMRGSADFPTTIISAASAYLPGDLRDGEDIDVLQLESAYEAAEQALERTGPGGRLMIFDSDRSDDEWIDDMLQALSEMRLDMPDLGRDRFVAVASSHGWRVSALRRFHVDEVIDTSWLVDSYFHALAEVLYRLIAEDPDHGQEALSSLGVRIAHAVASSVRRFVVRAADSFEVLDGESGTPLSLVGLELAEAVRRAELADSPRWAPVAIARVRLQETFGGDLAGATLRLLHRPDERIEAGDLVLGIAHL